MRFKTPDGSIVEDGRFPFMSIWRFVETICKGSSCFVCGARRSDRVPFNDEHILPDWLLRKHKLHGKTITLPNMTRYRYGSYLVPCCQHCNSRLGTDLETPISKAFAGGIESLATYVREEGIALLYQWLSLIYLKTHLKDSSLRADQRTPGASQMIGDIYEWEELHHVHAIARSHEAGAILGDGAIGSVMIVALKSVGPDYFDFVDNYVCRTIAICSGDVGVLAVMNDSCGALSMFSARFNPSDALTPIQFRELFAHFCYLNKNLKERPIHGTSVDMDTGDVSISAELPATGPAIEKGPPGELGELIEFACRDIIAQMTQSDGRTADDVRTLVRAGSYSFLFNENGEFVRQP